ncbi:MAG: hypothetical protein HC898_03420 [Phycisphaerales bacterium]|nr:hypothetical protein [Phycisphaerales bacterium]
MPAVGAVEYRMAPPDVITIYSKRVREINGHTEAIRSDGRISLPLIGSVMIAGKTPEEASGETGPDGSGILRGRRHQSARRRLPEQTHFRLGSCGHARSLSLQRTQHGLPHTEPGTANPSGGLGRVEILRPNRDGKLVKRMTIDLDKMIEEGNLEHDALLEENDVIYVPANPLAAVGLALQQLLLPLQPAAQTVNAPADIAQAATGTKPYGTAD